MKAKKFNLPDKDNNLISLKDYKDKWVVLYFYPKDLTSGCTIEANEFSKLKAQFKKLNAEIIGVSKDSPKQHQKFIEKENLEITLLSDETTTTLDKFGVWKEKSLYGRKYMGIERTTLLINPQGNIMRIWNKVKPQGHAEEVLGVLKEVITKAR